jgi:hypothetical protein
MSEPPPMYHLLDSEVEGLKKAHQYFNLSPQPHKKTGEYPKNPKTTLSALFRKYERYSDHPRDEKYADYPKLEAVPMFRVVGTRDDVRVYIEYISHGEPVKTMKKFEKEGDDAYITYDNYQDKMRDKEIAEELSRLKEAKEAKKKRSKKDADLRDLNAVLFFSTPSFLKAALIVDDPSVKKRLGGGGVKTTRSIYESYEILKRRVDNGDKNHFLNVTKYYNEEDEELEPSKVRILERRAGGKTNTTIIPYVKDFLDRYQVGSKNRKSLKYALEDIFARELEDAKTKEDTKDDILDALENFDDQVHHIESKAKQEKERKKREKAKAKKGGKGGKGSKGGKKKRSHGGRSVSPSPRGRKHRTPTRVPTMGRQVRSLDDLEGGRKKVGTSEDEILGH